MVVKREIDMISTVKSALFGAGALALMAGAASAGEVRDCFQTRDWRAWSSPDDQTFLLRMSTGDIYRIDLPAPVRQSGSDHARLSLGERNADKVCGPLDLDINLSAAGGFTLPLSATRISRLSAQDIAALPPTALPGQHGLRRRAPDPR
jgi:hypothetical protein